MKHRPLLLALLLLLPRAAWADTGVSFPLQGFFHPGRYMPVRVQADPAPPSPDPALRLEAHGALTTELTLGDARLDAVVPWMIYEDRLAPINLDLVTMSSDTALQRQSLPLSLRPLTDDQKLIGYATADAQFAQTLFPDAPLVSVRLEAADPLPGPPAAWDTLDAVILNGFGDLDSVKLTTLAASGTVVAVRWSGPPDPRLAQWPWRQVGDYWVLRRAPSGPVAALFDENIYRPVASWQAGWPAAFRRRIMLFAVLYAIFLLALVLWRPRWTALWGCALTAVLMLPLGVWWHFQSPVQECGGTIATLQDSLMISDTWVYCTSGSRAVATLPAPDITKPFFASRRHDRAVPCTLVCSAQGVPRMLRIDLPGRAARMAVLHRSAGPQAPRADPQMPVTSPLASLARDLYLRPGDRLIGELPPLWPLGNGYQDAQLWPTVLIRGP